MSCEASDVLLKKRWRQQGSELFNWSVVRCRRRSLRPLLMHHRPWKRASIGGRARTLEACLNHLFASVWPAPVLVVGIQEITKGTDQNDPGTGPSTGLGRSRGTLGTSTTPSTCSKSLSRCVRSEPAGLRCSIGFAAVGFVPEQASLCYLLSNQLCAVSDTPKRAVCSFH